MDCSENVAFGTRGDAMHADLVLDGRRREAVRFGKEERRSKPA